MALAPFEILVIDNDLNTVMALEEYLGASNRIVHRATNAGDALDIIKRTNIGLVIADMIMPNVDGFELIEMLEADPATRHIFALVILRRDSHLEDYIVRGLTHNAVDYLIKPVHREITQAKVSVFEKLYYKRLRLNEKNRKIRDLLLNILPESTAEELRISGKARPRSFDLATVMFTDFVQFTERSSKMAPQLLVRQLDHYFVAFDRIIDQYPIEKIKTIGDAYMAAGGLPIRNRTNPIDVVLAALDIRAYMRAENERLLEAGETPWGMRIGIHGGPLVAGVVGRKKWAYDVWGDTVNTAQRMESAGAAGEVNISQFTYEQIKEYFVCEHRGKIHAKHKGEIDMYYVVAIRPEYSENGAGERPNQVFLKRLAEQ